MEGENMTTQMDYARRGIATEEMKAIAKEEDFPINTLMKRIAKGIIVVTRNTVRENVRPLGIGEGLRTKINANIGTSRDFVDIEAEIHKAQISVKAGADTVMDLSTGGDIDYIRKQIIKAIDVPIGTVPIYQAVIEREMEGKILVDMTEDDMFDVIFKHAKDGVDFMTIHCGVNLESIERLKRQDRLIPLVSRGGTFLAAWILHHGEENPYYKNYDYLLEICKEYDVTISLGDGMRPGCIDDASDKAQFQELLVIGELVKRAREAGVQSMVEGPGHVPFDQIEANMRIQKTVCDNAPFYVLGPLVTDVAPGYDHIVGAIGGTLAAVAGADYLCYVTPAEHLSLPNAEDVWEGVMASKIAAHAADIVKYGKKASKWDTEMSTARANLDWDKMLELCIDPEKAKRYRSIKEPEEEEVCTMCGKFCAVKIINEAMGREIIPEEEKWH